LTNPESNSGFVKIDFAIRKGHMTQIKTVVALIKINLSEKNELSHAFFLDFNRFRLANWLIFWNKTSKFHKKPYLCTP
jgi:uncharacterized membrane protein YwzB